MKPVTGHQLVVIIDGNIPWDSVCVPKEKDYILITWSDTSSFTHCIKYDITFVHRLNGV